MSATLELVFYIVVAVLILIIIFWIFRTEQRLKKFFLGKKGKDLEDTIEILEKRISDLTAVKDKLLKDAANLDARLKKSIRGVETTRFNPFPDQGGNQSFATALVDEEGDGLVLSSLYSRDRVSVFAKPVKGGATEYDLTAEEQNVLWKAKEKTQLKT